jgi:uncharacterized membrane protein
MTERVISLREIIALGTVIATMTMVGWSSGYWMGARVSDLESRVKALEVRAH